MERLTLTIAGQVQGVGLRYAVCARARELGISGWVRNNADGSVGVVAEGTPESLRAFFNWCYTGVRSARVDAILAGWGGATGAHKDFSIRA